MNDQAPENNYNNTRRNNSDAPPTWRIFHFYVLHDMVWMWKYRFINKFQVQEQ